MTTQRPSLGKQEQFVDTLDERECHAMRLLRSCGWSTAELKMCFELDDSNVYRHLSGECWHSPFPVPAINPGDEQP